MILQKYKIYVILDLPIVFVILWPILKLSMLIPVLTKICIELVFFFNMMIYYIINTFKFNITDQK